MCTMRTDFLPTAVTGVAREVLLGPQDRQQLIHTHLRHRVIGVGSKWTMYLHVSNNLTRTTVILRRWYINVQYSTLEYTSLASTCNSKRGCEQSKQIDQHTYNSIHPCSASPSAQGVCTQGHRHTVLQRRSYSVSAIYCYVRIFRCNNSE